MYVECTNKCKNGESCQNQRINKRQYAKTKVVQTANRGWGLIAAEDIKSKINILTHPRNLLIQREQT